MCKTWEEKDIRKVLDEIGVTFEFPCNEVPIRISLRMTRGLGLFKFRRVSGKYFPVQFVFAQGLLKGKYGEAQIRETIIHEYVHFYMTIKFQAEHGHDYLFKRCCRTAGISDERTSSSPITEEYKTTGETRATYVVRCSCCNKIVGKYSKRTKVVNNAGKYQSKCCHKPINVSVEQMVI